MQSWEIKQICHDEGYSEGYDEGYGNGYDNGYGNGYDNGASQKLIEDVENAMESFHVDLQTACEGLKTTVEAYENAKKVMYSDSTNPSHTQSMPAPSSPQSPS